jgi:hypothetical protein
MRRLTVISFLAFFAFLVAVPEVAFAEGGIAWGPNGVPICTASNTQQNIRMVADGSGGAIIVWEDYRETDPDIYAQRISGDGNLLWGKYGVVVCTATNSQLYPVIVSDGSGGAIIAWEDRRYGSNSNIYALRISSDTGQAYLDWDQNGVVLSSTTADQLSPDITSDGYGGAIITWQETMGTQYLIRAQRIKSADTLLWGSTGIIVSSGPMPKENPKIINDGTGVIITWQDYSSTGNYDIYAQRLDINYGIIGWNPNGIPVSQTTGDQLDPQIVPDGSGGAIITWTDWRNGNPDIYAQWISSGGAQMWGSVTVTGSGDLNGIPICKEVNEQSKPFIMNDLQAGATKGAIIAWEDKRQDLNGDIYAEKVPLDVTSGWTGGGKAMATGNQIQKCPRLVSDNNGGGIITWIEKDSIITDGYKIFASKRNQDGDPVWSYYPGVLVYKGTEVKDHQIVSDGSGGVIIAWQSGPSTDYNIYAQRVIDNAVVPLSASISGRVTLSDGENGITGVEVWALKGEELVSSAITDTKGYYGITGLLPETTYFVRANWRVDDIESSVSKEAYAPSYSIDFTLEIGYLLGTIAGNVSGVEREAKRVSGAGLSQSLSPGNSIAFVELEQRGKVIVRVPVEADGNYSIPNLLPGRFVARAYNGSIYSEPRMVNLKEGETLRVDFAFGIMPEETVFSYPNPAKSGFTRIRYYCGYTDPEAEIKIYDIAGELVRKVKDSEINRDGTDPHIYRFLWDCKNSSGKGVASGIYIYMVEVKEKSNGETKKVIKRMAVIR